MTEMLSPDLKGTSIRQSNADGESVPDTTVAHYDENLLDRVRTQWQFGDWQSLCKLTKEKLQTHPDRAKISLLVAAGHLQLGSGIEAQRFIRFACDCGVSTKQVSQVLISGVHNVFGRIAAINNQNDRAAQHFETSIVIGAPGSDARLLTLARMNEQYSQIGLTDVVCETLFPSFNSLRYDHTATLVATVRACMESQDIHEAIDQVVLSGKLSSRALILFYFEISDQFAKRNDKLTALHYLLTVRDQLQFHDEILKASLVHKLVAIGRPELASDIVFETAVEGNTLQLSEADRMAILSVYEKNRTFIQKKIEHGHDLLLSYLHAHINEIVASRDVPPLVVEIGTTRENVPGQGSTRKIAEFCKIHGLRFITVDMDPHNTRMASAMFKQMDVKFEAVSMKGEDFLREYPGMFDFIFLDAYDFDHGNHSSLRQSRYEKYLGSRIDDSACHQMHLECAKIILHKLDPMGVVCFDDTWIENGRWTAKGTTAMPFLLENGFTIVESRNRAALLIRSNVKTIDAGF